MANVQRKSLEEEMEEFKIPTHEEDGTEMTKSKRKKLLAAAKKAAKKSQNAKKNQAQGGKAQQQEDFSAGKYGDVNINSSCRPGKVYTEISTMNKDFAGKEVLVRARIHTIRVAGRLAFIVLRQRYSTIQAVVQQKQGDGVSKQMFKYLSGIPSESVVNVIGVVRGVEEEIKAATQHDIEIGVTEIYCISRSLPNLPIQLEDAERPRPLIKKQKAEIAEIQGRLDQAKAELEAAKDEDKERLSKLVTDLTNEKSAAQKFVVCSRNERLNNRTVDLRTITNQAIFSVSSTVCALFREFLLARDFNEIHTPKIIGSKSEGGANVFSLSYFGRDAFLAQSPQLYKQMGICSDMNRVFEVAPVFRAENANTYRHMTEFIGLDMEMAFNEHYHEVLETLEQLFCFIFEGLNEKCKTQLEVIKRQYPFEDMVHRLPDGTTLRLRWPDIIKIMRETGIDKIQSNGTVGEPMSDLDDMNTTQEKELGKVIKQRYGVDFYVVDKFPSDIRPFYTMPDPEDNRYSNSYDIFIRGQEVLSGAQRIHEAPFLEEMARKKEVDPATIKDYVDAFRYGAWPHAGGGIGLERVVMLFLDLHNIREVSMFPRTPTRLTP